MNAKRPIRFFTTLAVYSFTMMTGLAVAANDQIEQSIDSLETSIDYAIFEIDPDEESPQSEVSLDYDLTWHTIDGGGGTSAGGLYELAGTIGQPDAGAMTGGDYVLAGGFWAGGVDVESECPIVGDLNCDGVVNVSDLLLLLGEWGPCANCGNCPADTNDDCNVNVTDLLMLLANWG